MSTVQSHEPAIHTAKSRTVDTNLEVVVILVSDVERAKDFYAKFAWRLDADFVGESWLIVSDVERPPARRSSSAAIALPAGITVDAEVTLNIVASGAFLSASLNVTIRSVARDVAQDLVVEAHESCPHSKATHSNIEVAIKLAEPVSR